MQRGVTSPQPKRGPCNWAYCTRRDAMGRWAVGYVRASNETEARKLAKRKAERMTATVLGFKGVAALRRHIKLLSQANGGRKPKGFVRRVFVWRDDKHECAPASFKP